MSHTSASSGECGPMLRLRSGTPPQSWLIQRMMITVTSPHTNLEYKFVQGALNTSNESRDRSGDAAELMLQPNHAIRRSDWMTQYELQ